MGMIKMDNNIIGLNDYKEISNTIETLWHYYDEIKTYDYLTDQGMYADNVIWEFSTLIMVNEGGIKVSNLLFDTLKKNHKILYKYITCEKMLKQFKDRGNIDLKALGIL